jgi:hypothetical protein
MATARTDPASRGSHWRAPDRLRLGELGEDNEKGVKLIGFIMLNNVRGCYFLIFSFFMQLRQCIQGFPNPVCANA